MSNILELTDAHHRNYSALCALMAGCAPMVGYQRNQFETLTSGQIRRKLYDQDYCCAHCGRDFVKKGAIYKDVTCDHVIPRKFGGKANYDNIVLVHYKCNRERDRKFSLKLIEEHYGRIDKSLILPYILYKDKT